jgi:hypothetical protein
MRVTAVGSPSPQGPPWAAGVLPAFPGHVPQAPGLKAWPSLGFEVRATGGAQQVMAEERTFPATVLSVQSATDGSTLWSDSVVRRLSVALMPPPRIANSVIVAPVTTVFAGTTPRFHLMAERRSTVAAVPVCMMHISGAAPKLLFTMSGSNGASAEA